MEFIMQPMTWLFNYSGSNGAAEKQFPGKSLNFELTVLMNGIPLQTVGAVMTNVSRCNTLECCLLIVAGMGDLKYCSCIWESPLYIWKLFIIRMNHNLLYLWFIFFFPLNYCNIAGFPPYATNSCPVYSSTAKTAKLCLCCCQTDTVLFTKFNKTMQESFSL